MLIFAFALVFVAGVVCGVLCMLWLAILRSHRGWDDDATDN